MNLVSFLIFQFEDMLGFLQFFQVFVRLELGQFFLFRSKNQLLVDHGVYITDFLEVLVLEPAMENYVMGFLHLELIL